MVTAAWTGANALACRPEAKRLVLRWHAHVTPLFELCFFNRVRGLPRDGGGCTGGGEGAERRGWQYGSGAFLDRLAGSRRGRESVGVPSKGAHNIIDTVTVGDGRAVFLYLPKMTAAMQLELKLDLTDPAVTEKLRRMCGNAVCVAFYATQCRSLPLLPV